MKTCAVCLEDYRPGDRLRMLHPCAHCFHASCIDAWFATEARLYDCFVCPICKCGVVEEERFGKTEQRKQVERERRSERRSERERWENVQLIDLSVHESWVEWFSGLVKLYLSSERAETAPS